MSGRRPDVTKVWDFEHHFREQGVGSGWTSLPQSFKKAGYFTTGVGKLFHPDLPPNADAISWSDPLTFPITFVGRGSACPPSSRACDSSGPSFHMQNAPDVYPIPEHSVPNIAVLCGQHAQSRHSLE